MDFQFQVPTIEDFWKWVEHWQGILGSLSRFDIGLHWFAIGTILLVCSIILGRRKEKVFVEEADYDDDNFAPDSDEDQRSYRYQQREHQFPVEEKQFTQLRSRAEFQKESKDYTQTELRKLQSSFSYRFFFLIRIYRFIRDMLYNTFFVLSRFLRAFAFFCYFLSLWYILGIFFKAFVAGIIAVSVPWMTAFGQLQSRTVLIQLAILGTFGLWISWDPTSLHAYSTFAGALLCFFVTLLGSSVSISREITNRQSGFMGLFGREEVTKIQTKVTLLDYLRGNWVPKTNEE
jgi:hypothetical protein